MPMCGITHWVQNLAFEIFGPCHGPFWIGLCVGVGLMLMLLLIVYLLLRIIRERQFISQRQRDSSYFERIPLVTFVNHP